MCAIMEQDTDDRKLRLQIFNLMKDIERSKLDLLADTTIAKEIIRDYKQKQEKLASKIEDKSTADDNEEFEEEEPEDKETEILETIDDMTEEEGPNPEE